MLFGNEIIVLKKSLIICIFAIVCSLCAKRSVDSNVDEYDIADWLVPSDYAYTSYSVADRWKRNDIGLRSSLCKRITLVANSLNTSLSLMKCWGNVCLCFHVKGVEFD